MALALFLFKRERFNNSPATPLSSHRRRRQAGRKQQLGTPGQAWRVEKEDWGDIVLMKLPMRKKDNLCETSPYDPHHTNHRAHRLEFIPPFTPPTSFSTNCPFSSRYMISEMKFSIQSWSKLAPNLYLNHLTVWYLPFHLDNFLLSLETSCYLLSYQGIQRDSWHTTSLQDNHVLTVRLWFIWVGGSMSTHTHTQ